MPPFRVLLLNESGDFFAGSPGAVFSHIRRRGRNFLRSAWVRCGEVLQGAALFCFAFVAQWNSAVSRWAFRRIQGTQALSLQAFPSGEGIARFSYRGREWNQESLQQLTEKEESRWILLEGEGTWPDAEDLLPLFADPATFVVSRQTGQRKWRKLLFATAPFRQLQQDEATQVMAPVSGQMMVDRAKLQALGIPALSSFGSNWYLLFWKAAACGWKSYSVGSANPSGELAAVPFDEAEFVKTLLAEKTLQTLAPQNPELMRGTIARANGYQPQFRGLPRVLVVSPYLPFPLSHGGAVRIYNLCRALMPRVDFVLVCFREKGEQVHYARLLEVFRDVFVVDIDEKKANPLLPKQVSEYQTESMRSLMRSICREHNIDLVQVEYTQMAMYREAAAGVPAILVEHDLTFSLYRQLAEQKPTEAAMEEYEKWLRFERECFHRYDAVWTMSALDRLSAVEQGSAPEQTFIVPNGVDLYRFTSLPKTVEEEEILYVGSFRHRPNYMGFEELCTTIMPAVWQHFPEIRLRVVAGPDYEKYWTGERKNDARIVVHGFVEDLAPLYRESTLVVVPLPVSAGTNIKLMEALACGRAVVTTAVGCAGLQLSDGKDVLIRELGAAFAEEICELLSSPEKRTQIAMEGRRTAERRFGWDSIAEPAFANYQAMLRMRSCA